jgi:hypothetical protein
MMQTTPLSAAIAPARESQIDAIRACQPAPGRDTVGYRNWGVLGFICPNPRNHFVSG